jgi:hypothetical protein
VKHRLFYGLAFALALGCHHEQGAEGPMQRAGKHVDDAAEKTGKALEKAAEKTDAAAHRAVTATGVALEKAGRKLEGSPSATPKADTAKPPP